MDQWQRANEPAVERSTEPYLGAHTPPMIAPERLITGRACFLPFAQVFRLAAEVKSLSGEDYESRILQPARHAQRWSVRKALPQLFKKLSKEVENGPLFAAEALLEAPEGGVEKGGAKQRRVGIIGQNKDVQQGVWSPEHHAQAVELAVAFARKRLPIISFIDTPGADAAEAANQHLQAHRISRLISVMAQLPVPTVGVIFGSAYSGGAIPLAATNLLLAVKDALFSTIQPQGLASIARKQNLSWQQCAQRASVSAVECASQGWLDAVVDYSPVNGKEQMKNLSEALWFALQEIDAHTLEGLVIRPSVPNEGVFLSYQRLIQRFAENPKAFPASQNPFFGGGSTENLPSVSGYLVREMRQQQVLSRLRCRSKVELPEEPVDLVSLSGDNLPSPKGVRESASVFCDWLQRGEKLVYEERLLERYKKWLKARGELAEERGTFFSLVLGRPDDNYQQARQSLCFELGLYLLNRWKTQSRNGFLALEAHLKTLSEPADCQSSLPEPETMTLARLVSLPELTEALLVVSAQMRMFEALYDGVLHQLELVAQEANRHHQLSQDSMGQLLSAALKDSAGVASLTSEEMKAFSVWLKTLMQLCDLGGFLRALAEWKQHQHARISESLFVFITYVFEKLIPRYLCAMEEGKPFDGRISPTWIGRRKDFWHRLSVAYCDLQIQALQRDYKSQWPDWQGWVDELCETFTPLHTEWISADPCVFPGFDKSLKKEVARGGIPAGMVTGIAQLKQPGRTVGLFLSNLSFQAGALDMASARKLLSLIDQCDTQRLPLVGVVSSGGMQTKEGAGSLFSMAAINEAISRYHQRTGLPVVMIGFGDCTGGAQASFVTHPMVKTWYISGANIPFAGQIVVPSYLPSTCTLANYLSDLPGAMQGLLSHPFANSFDERLYDIDASMPRPRFSIQEMLAVELNDPSSLVAVPSKKAGPAKSFRPPRKVLIHARGCTATKLITDIRNAGLPIVLVQSDPDMSGYPAELLGNHDQLVCIGGNTPDESYLNANSVLQVATMTGADALHPGIGFLSEDPDFAKRCQVRGLNFIGPDYRAMIQMGDKSMALKAAMEAGVPVVPGSHGLVNDIQQARKVADRIGYPLLLKAVFGGGGKGIARLDRAEDLAETFSRLSREAEAAFGRGELYMERFVSRMRHIEVQLLRDRHGHCKLPGLRDCSVQRQNQKLLEESGSTLLSAELEAQALSFAERVATQVDYVGAGTVEFIFDLDHERLYFMEMNTRLQVEHPVTEKVSGLGIVALQLKIAAGESIEHLQWEPKGYAIEARVNAEKVSLVTRSPQHKEVHCQPSPGKITELSLPKDDAVQVIRCVDEGKMVTPFYDSLIMQVIAYGPTRDAAIAKLSAYLKNTRIRGVHTNIRLLNSLLDAPGFIRGEFDTALLNQLADSVVADQVESEEVETGIDWIDMRIPGTQELKVLAPNTSVFYRSATPEDQPFIHEGDLIDVHQTLCLMEAMKVYSPLKLDQLNKGSQSLYEECRRYRVNRILNQDGDQVNAGDLLFVLQPEEAVS